MTCWMLRRARARVQDLFGRLRYLAGMSYVLDLDLRKLRYFVAVAEELHFGRAAERLHVAQPVISRQIRALEDELNSQLFKRDRRRTELTAAGRQLLEDARPLLLDADALRRRVERAGSGAGTFTVGFMSGLIITPVVRQLSDAHPELTVDVLRTSWLDQIDVIHDGRVDVGYVRLPIDKTGLQLIPMFTEPRMVVLPASHRLAGNDSVSITELADDHLLQDPTAVPEWQAIASELRSRATPPPIPPLRTVEEKLEHVAAGNGFAIIPRSTALFYRRPDVAALPVDDISDNQVCLAWDSVRRSGLIREFAELAQRHAQLAEATV
jgi:DNA-binding transcriptional LysR family regulator